MKILQLHTEGCRFDSRISICVEGSCSLCVCNGPLAQASSCQPFWMAVSRSIGCWPSPSVAVALGFTPTHNCLTSTLKKRRHTPKLKGACLKERRGIFFYCLDFRITHCQAGLLSSVPPVASSLCPGSTVASVPLQAIRSHAHTFTHSH